MPIRVRLAIVFTAMTLVLLCAGGYLFVAGLRSGLERNLDLTLSARAEAISSGLVMSHASSDAYQLATVNGIYAQLVSVHGAVLASSSGLDPAAMINAQQATTAADRQLVSDTTVVLRTPDDAGAREMRLLARAAGRPGVVVAVAVSRDVVDDAVRGATHQLVLLGILALVLAGPGSWLLIRAALRPVERIRAQVARLHSGDSSATLTIARSHDEIARLAQTFNGLLAHLQAALAHERTFVADAGHELRTPLAVLKGELELARRPGRTRTELADAIEVAADETDRLINLAENLLWLARDADAPVARRQRLNLVALARCAADEFTSVAATRGVQIIVSGSGPVEVLGEPDRIRQAVDNLLANALRYSPPEAAVTITVTAAPRTAQITVTDSGPGFPPQFLPVAFERFTRADDARAHQDAGPSGSSGLGLAIVRSVMTAHGGTATAGNAPDGGAQVTLSWPPATHANT